MCEMRLSNWKFTTKEALLTLFPAGRDFAHQISYQDGHDKAPQASHGTQEREIAVFGRQRR
jgi:hypothetical protein